MTAEISINEIAPSINLGAGPAGFNIRTDIEGPPTVGPGGVITVQTKLNEADRKRALEENNRGGNKKFALKNQKKVPVGPYSRLPVMAERTLAARQQFNSFAARYAPRPSSRSPQMTQNSFERRQEKLWGVADQAIRREPLSRLLVSGFGCLSQSTRDRQNEIAALNGQRMGPDGTPIDRRKPTQPMAAQANAQAPQAAPSPKVGMDRRQASRTATQNARSPLMEAYARLSRSGLMLGTFDGPRYKGQA
jgi:hypothetical protein